MVSKLCRNHLDHNDQLLLSIYLVYGMANQELVDVPVYFSNSSLDFEEEEYEDEEEQESSFQVKKL